jgi:hypothetical protein
MRFAAGPPAMWRITLTSGAEVELWADGCALHPVDRDWVFSILVDATPEEQRVVRVQDSAAVPSERVVVVVARIPSVAVANIEGGWSLLDDPRAAPAGIMESNPSESWSNVGGEGKR